VRISALMRGQNIFTTEEHGVMLYSVSLCVPGG
jgi:hypothetical protein